MGFYIRKSISAGPFRFNLSGHGVGMSVGVKGFRVGTGPRGNYVSMGHGGLYYRASLGGHSRKQTVRSGEYLVPTPAPSAAREQLVAIETGNVLAMEPSNGSHIVEQINEKIGLVRVWIPCLIFGEILAVALLALPNLFWAGVAVAAVTLVATIIAARWDQARRAVVIMYDLQDDAASAFKEFCDEFDIVATAQRVWNIETAGRTDEWKRNAGASRLLTRQAAHFGYGVPSVIRTNINAPCISGGRHTLHFMPDVVLVMDGSRCGALAYDQLSVIWNTALYIESEGVPSDTQVVGSTWQYVNKDGGPDRRFNGNRQIPKVSYQQMGLQGTAGLQKLLYLSKVADRQRFDTALSKLRALVKRAPLQALPAPLPTNAGGQPHAENAPSSSGSQDNGSHEDVGPTMPTTEIGIALAVSAVVALFAVYQRTPHPDPFRSDVVTQTADTAPTPAPELPSFDCKLADTDVLKLICATPSLAVDDRQMATAYQAALVATRHKNRLAKQQQDWLKLRDKTSADVASLEAVYVDRINKLQMMGQRPP